MVEQNFNKSIPYEISKIDCFLVSNIDRILLFKSDTYHQKSEFNIDLQKSTTREPN